MKRSNAAARVTRDAMAPRRTAVSIGRTARIIPIAVLAASLALAACGRSSAPQKDAADESTATMHPVTVKVATVITGTVDRVISVSGLVTPEPGAEMIIVAPQPARIARLAVAVGDTVRRGQTLVEFDIPALESDLATREADVAQAQARTRNAEANHTRLAHLFERGIAAQKEVEDAQKELTDARAALAQATRGRAAAQTMASRQTVRMPFDGIVAQRWRSAGEMVDGTSAMPVLRVIDPDRLQVEASIPPEESALVHAGQLAHVRGARAAATATTASADADADSNANANANAHANAGPSATAWDAKVLTAPRVVDAQSGAAIARLTLPRNVAPSGLPVQVDIIVSHASGLIVPASAIVRDGDKTWCYVLAARADDASTHAEAAGREPRSAPATAAASATAKADDAGDAETATYRAERREVTVGLITTRLAQITRGLVAGDRVIAQGQQSLPDKAIVRIEREQEQP